MKQLSFMAEIKKLQIQGIRSFGPSQDDRQNIEFSSPLTLILGQNGCGKTTIIGNLFCYLLHTNPPVTTFFCFRMSEVRHHRRCSSRHQQGILLRPRPQDGQGDVCEGSGEADVHLQGQQRDQCQDDHQISGGFSEVEEHFRQNTRLVVLINFCLQV